MPHGAWVIDGMGGKLRLDYALINGVLFEHFGVKKGRRKQVLADLMVMEVPALEAMRKK